MDPQYGHIIWVVVSFILKYYISKFLSLHVHYYVLQICIIYFQVQKDLVEIDRLLTLSTRDISKNLLKNEKTKLESVVANLKSKQSKDVVKPKSRLTTTIKSYCLFCLMLSNYFSQLINVIKLFTFYCWSLPWNIK